VPIPFTTPGLKPADCPAREALCWWFVQQCTEPPFLLSVMLSNKARFGRDGKLNFHNHHHWANDNPHSVLHSRHQQQFSIVLLVIGRNVCFVSSAYRRPLLRPSVKWLARSTGRCTTGGRRMHGGTAAHFSRDSRDVLSSTYCNRWIGREGPTAWLPETMSMELNPF
jgi:hypothetical protein